VKKLRLLSLLTIASQRKEPPSSTPSSASNLSYNSLCTRLRLESSIELEQLVTEAIYSDLVVATLNPALQTVVITSVAPLRDLAPGSVQSMIDELAAWSKRCSSVLADLEAEIQKVKDEAELRAGREARTERQVKAAMDALGRAPGGLAGGPGQAASMEARLSNARAARREQGLLPSDDQDAMDVDGGAVLSGAGKKKNGGIMAQLQKGVGR
jgi:COP9 signalosome complex subunit 7